MGYIANIIFLLVLVIYTVYYYFDTLSLKHLEEKMVVITIAAVFICAVLINIIQIIKDMKNDSKENVIPKINLKKTFSDRRLIFLLFTVAYLILIKILGFFISSFIYFLFLSRLLGEKRFKVLLGVPVIMLGVIFIFFVMFLGIHLPKGLIF